MPSPITTPGYRYATQRYPLDGVETDFEFNFAGGYIAEEYVTAYLMDVFRVQTQIPFEDIEFIGPNQIRIASIVSADITDILIIRRDTPKDLPLLDFTDGAILNDRNLNKNTRQAIHGIAEMVDLFADMISLFDELNAEIIDAIDEITILITTVNNLIDEITIIINGLTDPTFLALEDTPDTYVGQGGKYVAVNDVEDALEFKDVSQVVVDLIDEIGDNLSVLDLNDTPDSYAGQADKFIKVKGTEDGIEFVSGLSADGMPSTIAYSRRDSSSGLSFVLSGGVVRDGEGNFDVVADQTIVLTDDSVNYLRATRSTGNVTKSTTTFNSPTNVPLWRITTVAGVVTEALDWRSIISLNVPTFGGSAGDLGLLDVPLYTGNALKILRAAATEDQLEYIDLSAANVSYDNAVSGLTATTVQDAIDEIAGASGVTNFTDLADVPAAYTGEAGKYVAVNGTEDGLEFLAPPAASYLTLTDTDPAAYAGFAGFGIRVNATETGTEFGRFFDFRRGNTALGGNERHGVWCDPNNDGSLPADGSTDVYTENDLIIATKTTLQSPSSGYGSVAGGNVGYGSYIRARGLNNTFYGSNMQVNGQDNLILGTDVVAGEFSSGTARLYNSIMLYSGGAGSPRGLTGTSLEQQLIAIGDQTGTNTNEKNSYSVYLGHGQGFANGSNDHNYSVNIGYGASGISAAGNCSGSIALGYNSRAYCAGSYNTNHTTVTGAVGSTVAGGYVRMMFSRRTTDEYESTGPNVPWKLHPGGDTGRTVIDLFGSISGSGSSSHVVCVKGFAMLKNRPAGQPDCTIWEYKCFMTSSTGSPVILSQTWTRGPNFYTGLADPAFVIDPGTGLLCVEVIGSPATTLYWSVFSEIFIMD